jgi:hypothetical protein
MSKIAKGFTYLQTLLDAKKVSGKVLIGQYEAALSQAAMISRLMYDPNEVIAKTAQFVHYNPIVFNTALGIIRTDYSRVVSPNKKQEKFVIVPNPIRPENKDGLILNTIGHMDDTPCYLQYLDYSQKQANVPFPGEKILYIAFRGTISIGGGLADANLLPLGIDEVLKTCTFGGQTGSQVFAEEIKQSSFLCHQGFVRQMKNIMNKVCKALETKFLKLPIDRIVITGHSLGAANATLASLILGGFKRAGLITPPIHCMTFGGPKLFVDYSRNVYNSLLESGILTLDRVAIRSSGLKTAMWSIGTGGLGAGSVVDLVPLIPPNFVHPGFMILKTEGILTKLGSRTNNISDMRKLVGGIEPPSAYRISLTTTVKGTFNGFATYKEYLDCFDPLLAARFEEILNVTGTLGPWRPAYRAEYAQVKVLVDKVLGKVAIDPTTDPSKEPSAIAPSKAVADAASKEVEEEKIGQGADSDSNVGIEEGDKGTGQAGGAFGITSLSGSQTKLYMEKTKQYAPNHIKYAANLNVAPVSAHLGYCGIGWNGIGKNVQHIRGLCQEIQYGQTPIAVPYCSDETPEESAARVAANAVAMANPTMTGGRRRKVNHRNKTKKAKSKSRNTRSNKH